MRADRREPRALRPLLTAVRRAGELRIRIPRLPRGVGAGSSGAGSGSGVGSIRGRSGVSGCLPRLGRALLPPPPVYGIKVEPLSRPELT